MNFLDQTLTGAEPLIQAIEAACGPLAAGQYVSQHNNWCTQFVGFEEYVNCPHGDDQFLAPSTNVSSVDH